jgi:hypothetical protein
VKKVALDEGVGSLQIEEFGGHDDVLGVVEVVVVVVVGGGRAVEKREGLSLVLIVT